MVAYLCASFSQFTIGEATFPGHMQFTLMFWEANSNAVVTVIATIKYFDETYGLAEMENLYGENLVGLYSLEDNSLFG